MDEGSGWCADLLLQPRWALHQGARWSRRVVVAGCTGLRLVPMQPDVIVMLTDAACVLCVAAASLHDVLLLLRQADPLPRTAACRRTAAPSLCSTHRAIAAHHTRTPTRVSHRPKVSLWQAHLRVGKRIWCLLRACRCSRVAAARCACADLARGHLCAWAGPGEAVAPVFTCRSAVLRVLDGGGLLPPSASQPNSNRRRTEQTCASGWGWQQRRGGEPIHGGKERERECSEGRRLWPSVALSLLFGSVRPLPSAFWSCGRWAVGQLKEERSNAEMTHSSTMERNHERVRLEAAGAPHSPSSSLRSRVVDGRQADARSGVLATSATRS
jgi:hypothetical protein